MTASSRSTPQDYRITKLKDSLEQVLQKPQLDTARIKNLIQLAGLYGSNEVSQKEKGFQLIQQAYRLSQKINYPRGTYLSLSSFAGYYDDRNDYVTTLVFLKQALDIAITYNFYKEIHDTYSGILNLHFHAGDFISAMQTVTYGFELAEKRNDLERVAKYTSLFGFIFLRQGNTAAAHEFYRKYLTQTIKLNKNDLMAEAYEYLADVMMYKGLPDSALIFRFKSLELYHREFEKGKALARRYKYIYNVAQVGLAYSVKGEYEKALPYCLDAIKSKPGYAVNDYELAGYLIITANVYTALGQFMKADSLLREGLAISKKIKHAENTRDAYLGLSQLFAQRKQFDSALQYYQFYGVLKDSIMNVQSRKEIERIQSESTVEKKDRQIALKEQEAKTQRLITYGIIGASLTVFTILYLFYSRYQLKQKSRFQEELNKKQNELFNTVAAIQDNERKRIAQDIHDQVGSVLSAAKLQLSGLDELRSQLTEDQAQKYASAMMLMDQVAEELRNISHNLMPATLSRLGLVAAIQAFFDKISEHSPLKIQFNAHGFERRVDESIEINIYPMVLELINNVVKHAEATEVSVQLIRYPEYINITVEDNGKGIGAYKLNGSAGGIGIQSMKSRIDFLKGSINIDSVEGKGTTVMVDVPVRE